MQVKIKPQNFKLQTAGLEVNAAKRKYTFTSYHQSAGQNHYIKVANKSFGNVARFGYLGIMVTNQNCIQE
jgi:hypothetical protein